MEPARGQHKKWNGMGGGEGGTYDIPAYAGGVSITIRFSLV